MSDDLDLDAAMAAAEQAAGSGDFVAAERHLRDAARLQEEALGPAHPDLANTLNNLGVVYERTGRTDEAEASYRRAYTIARETLAADHPFVATSAENLREFCETNGRPFNSTDTSPLGLTAQPSTEGAQADDPPPVEESAFTPPRAGAATSPIAEARARSPRWRMLLLVVGIAVVVALWVFARSQSRQSRSTSTPAESAMTAGGSNAPATETSPSSARAASAPTTPAAFPASEPSSPAPSAVGPDVPPRASSAPAAPSVPPPTRATSSASPVPAPFPTATRRGGASAAGVTLVRADVCDSFSTRASSGADWRCDAIGGTASPGALVFYTRIRSPRATTVEHRWYRDDALVQSVRLRLGANPGAGYRTYSRNTVSAGTWRVELRASDGTVLHEARFTVR
jgi:hypothetical protein